MIAVAIPSITLLLPLMVIIESVFTLMLIFIIIIIVIIIVIVTVVLIAFMIATAIGIIIEIARINFKLFMSLGASQAFSSRLVACISAVFSISTWQWASCLAEFVFGLWNKALSKAMHFFWMLTNSSRLSCFRFLDFSIAIAHLLQPDLCHYKKIPLIKTAPV